MAIFQILLAFAKRFTQDNPTPDVTASKSVSDPTVANAYIKLKTDGYVYDQDDVQLAAFGSPTGGINAAGKYWAYTTTGIDPPNYTNMTGGSYVAVGDTYYCGATQSGVGSYFGTFEIRVADDIAGTNAATGGFASCTATVV